MECLYCQGTLTRTKVSYTANRNGYHLIIDEVPAWVCAQCGEPMFDEPTVEAIQAMLREIDEQRSRLDVLAQAA
jgi:YgiT-type zinc finger domain-containing protein